ncbi:hypothetical protein OFO11_34140, partial [Escherichia coli]|nr:hypothetical protein [Escherichia coli]
CRSAMTSSPSWLAKRRNRQAKVNRPVTFVHKKSPNTTFGLVVLPINNIIPQNETATINYWHDNKGI